MSRDDDRNGTLDEELEAILEKYKLGPEPGKAREANCTDFSILHTDKADYLRKLDALREIVDLFDGIPIDRRRIPWLITGSDGGGPP